MPFSRPALWRLLWLIALLSSAQAESLELTVARQFVDGFEQTESRLADIEDELNLLPQPYEREPTGTGGYLSQEHELFSSEEEVVITFSWDMPIELDAVALFPLRLFMDEVYGENLYWPGSVRIEAEIDDETNIIAMGSGGHPRIAQSLPELIEFEPIVTTQLTIRCTQLPQHSLEKWHAAGFAEVCVFSDADNVAPRAKIETSTSRQGYFVLAREFLTDGQTPLGLPELSSRPDTHDFIKKLDWEEQPPPRAYLLTCIFPEATPIDTVRIDPAIQHSYGQSFPVRFTIDLLDAEGLVLRSDTTYENFPLRNPGLNAHFAHFPETLTHAVRLRVLEASNPFHDALSAIALSEITPLHRGTPAELVGAIEEYYSGQTRRYARGDPKDTPEMKALASASDGLTQSGKVLPLRDWVTGLDRRQQLMEERITLEAYQAASLARVANIMILGSLALLIIGGGGAIFMTARNRIRTRREIRATRAMIASDLHDDVGSNLGTIILHVERLQELAEQPPEPRRLQAIYRLTRESVFGLREVLNTTAPEVGRTQDLVAYMQELTALLLGRTPYTFDTTPAISDELKDHALRKGLLLFFKEALYNAKTHADCSQINISLQRHDGKIDLRIEDNGKGIDPATLEKPHTLRTLKQRAEWLGAKLELKSSPGEGTEVMLSILQRERKRRF